MVRIALLIAALLLGAPSALRAEPNLSDRLVGSVVGVMRHGGAVQAGPGTSPPVPGCDTSAIMTNVGREEIRRWGAALRAAGLAGTRVETSRQCSAWETAQLLDLGLVVVNPRLDPAATPALRRERLFAALEDAVQSRQAGGPPVILLTHRANIVDLTGIEIQHGEILLLRLHTGSLALTARLPVE